MRGIAAGCFQALDSAEAGKAVRHRRQGRETHYRAQPDALAPMVNWLDLYGAFWRERFDRLESLLQRMNHDPFRERCNRESRTLVVERVFPHHQKSCGARSRIAAPRAVDDEQ